MTIATVNHVSKRYRLSRLGSKSIREELQRFGRRLAQGSRAGDGETEDFYALRDVSFDIEKGETLGFIGSNGSGKSTILKLLARIIYPTNGKLTVRGSVASLIEVGAGFHPELTGRENVFLYGSIMGMKRAEVRKKFDQIVAFAELERFIDTPVKRYSSGMYVRLGFAVAAHINPQILLVDEVLAVGDAAFQSKCQQRIEELRRGGMTIVFVSHDMTAVERLCNRVIFLQHGKIASEGAPQKVISDYYNAVVFKSAENENALMTAGAENFSGREAEILNVRFLDRDGLEIDALATGEPLIAQIEYRANQPIADPVFELFFYSADDRLHTHYTTALTGEHIPKLQGHGIVEIEVDEFGLTPGIFKIDASLMRRGAIAPYDWKPRQYLLKVLPGKKIRGMFYSPHRWRLVPLGDAQARGAAAAEPNDFL
jgi:ABC-type polysaccharide/polyol phosphate transport system ATPase subunit